MKVIFSSRPRPPRSLRWGTVVLVNVLAMSLSLAGFGAELQGQTVPRALSVDDYDRWRSIESTGLSPDGEWITFAYGHRVIEDTLIVRSLGGSSTHAIPGGTDPAFSDDSRWLGFANGSDVGLLDLSTGEVTTWENASSFTFAGGSGAVAIKKRRAGDGEPAGGEPDHAGTLLILHSLTGGPAMSIDGVDEFSFNFEGSRLAYTVDKEERRGNGLYSLDLTSGRIAAHDQTSLRYARLTWNTTGTAVAVLAGRDDEGLAERVNTLVAVRDLDGGSSTVRVDPEQGAVPNGFVLSSRGGLKWREDMSQIFVGLKEQRPALVDDPDNPRPNVDIFHWNDDRIQTVQRARAEADRNFTYLAAADLDGASVVRLADETMRTVTLNDGGTWGVGRDDRAYVSDWREPRADYYRVDTRTGSRTPIVEAQMQTLGLSPLGTHWAYWRDGHVWIHELDSGRTVNVTEGAPVSFVNEQFDRAGTKPPYGVGGWTTDGTGVVLNGRHDLWLQPLDGSPGRSLTGGAGGRGEIRHRLLSLDGESTVDLDRPILLATFGEWTKKSGFSRLRGGTLETLAFGDREYDNLEKAADAERYVFTSSTFADFPDLYVTDGGFRSPERVTDANPQQADYTWGHRILFEYENEDGVRLQGTLAIPNGYVEGERLPMLVNFYEKKSQELHTYYAPMFGGSYPSGNAGPVAEFAAYVSNGYLVMQADVHFNIGSSHSDMLDCVTAAVRKVIEMGYADPERIALLGGSYSGGGAAFIATQTDMFAAVVSRAAPINLAGEFNILFSGSGQNNHSYDIYGQGRYGTNPFDDFDLYRRESPITHVQNMNTPLLYLHGKQDPSVEYLQGMEFYNALRFLGKPIIFLSYPDEGHNLRRYENQLDFTRRLWQFLDHHLKGEPAPEWMTKGVPFLDRGYESEAGRRVPSTGARTGSLQTPRIRV